MAENTETTINNDIQVVENHKIGENAKINYGTTTVLKMIFTVTGGTKVTWNLKYPKTTLTKAQVTTFMEMIISEDAMLYNNNSADGIEDMYIYETSYIEIPRT